MDTFSYIPEPKTEAGNYKTRTLFKELQAFGDVEDPIFSLEMFCNSMEGGLISFYKLYMDFCTADPTEVELIDRVFNRDKRHWEAIKSLKGFEPYYKEMVAEARQRSLAKQFKKLEELSHSEKQNISLQASKALFEYSKSIESALKKSIKRDAKDTYETLVKNEATKEVEEALSRIQ